MSRKRKASSILLPVLVVLRRTIDRLQGAADHLEGYIDTAKEDTYDIIDKTQEISERIELTNFIKLLTFLTVVGTFITLFISAHSMATIVVFTDRIDVSIIIISFLLLMANIFYFAWQTLLIFQYKPFEQVPYDKLPSCSVIVPAFNESQGVCKALESVMMSEYPIDKLEIIAVNDGSRDDTWYWMNKTAEESNGRIKTINLEKNAGKRNALYQGFKIAKGSIVVTIDSDSIVMKDTISQIVAPFVRDRKIGGVAGNIRVLNFDEGIIPKMLDVSFVFSFEFLRSAQSVIRSVLCTPGALSAYRRKLVMPFMDEWVNQLFWGKPANIGEDRAITNFLLRDGYDVVFQKTSIAYTEVPTSYKGLCKMLIRWARSNVRENIAMTEFTFNRIDLEDENLLGMQINLVMQSVWMITPMLFLSTTFYCLFVDPWTFLYSVLTVIIIWSTFPAFVYASRYNKNEALWSYVYGVFNFVALSWIGPYSVLTVHRSGWLTRQEPKGPALKPGPPQMGTAAGSQETPKVS